MKPVYAAILLSLIYHPAPAQGDAGRTFLKTSSNSHLYYVDMNDSAATVYKMGKYMDKAGMGYSIEKTDALQRQADGSYSGNKIKIERGKDKLYLVAELKKTRKFEIENVATSVLNHNLNNAYYLDSYFRMSRELNNAYPLHHHSFRNGYSTWKELPSKELDHLQFRKFVDDRLRNIRDSIGRVQERYIALTNHIIKNIGTLDYLTFKDSLAKLPAQYAGQSSYYRAVINAAATQKPEYFFRLAEDFPANKNLIFVSVENNREVFTKMKAVEGHDEIKKAFFKEKKIERSIPYRVIGAYAALAGLITLLIVSQ